MAKSGSAFSNEHASISCALDSFGSASVSRVGKYLLRGIVFQGLPIISPCNICNTQVLGPSILRIL